MRPNPRPYLAQAAECLEQAAGLAAEHGLLLFEVLALRDRGGGGRRSSTTGCWSWGSGRHCGG